MAWKLGQDSFHKLIVWFVDGNKRTRYSIDWTHKYSRTRNQELGMKRLYKEVEKWGTRAQVVEIYENIYGTQNGPKVARFEFGMQVELKK
ncbi:MAG: hypothetical protein HY062_09220 [Bacteroidetes bacterium]|nr:hypothetical protein [Bacteroidota bacterium]